MEQETRSNLLAFADGAELSRNTTLPSLPQTKMSQQFISNWFGKKCKRI